MDLPNNCKPCLCHNHDLDTVAKAEGCGKSVLCSNYDRNCRPPQHNPCPSAGSCPYEFDLRDRWPPPTGRRSSQCHGLEVSSLLAGAHGAVGTGKARGRLRGRLCGGLGGAGVCRVGWIFPSHLDDDVTLERDPSSSFAARARVRGERAVGGPALCLTSIGAPERSAAVGAAPAPARVPWERCLRRSSCRGGRLVSSLSNPQPLRTHLPSDCQPHPKRRVPVLPTLPIIPSMHANFAVHRRVDPNQTRDL